MIKFSLFLLFAFFVSTNVSAQEDYLDKIAQESCDCVQKIQKGLSENERNMQFGLCIITASGPYKEELLRDHNIDLNQIDTQGEELGQLIGFRMSVVCADILLTAVGSNQGATEEENSEIIVEGTISKVEDDGFVVFTLKESDGTVGQYHWLTFRDAEVDISTQYKKLKSQNVQIGYTILELFDPGINQYRNYRVINSLVPLDN